MDEFIEILNNDGSFSGKSILKSEAHKKGIFHASAHIWICNLNDEVLIQKRISTKNTFPDLWDISVAGHISFGETPLTSAIREIDEEIGLQVQKDQLNFTQTFKKKALHNNGIIDYELHYIFVCKIDFQLNELTAQDSEVSDLKLIPLEVFLKTTSLKNFVPHGAEYFQLVHEALKKLQ